MTSSAQWHDNHMYILPQGAAIQVIRSWSWSRYTQIWSSLCRLDLCLVSFSIIANKYDLELEPMVVAVHMRRPQCRCCKPGHIVDTTVNAWMSACSCLGSLWPVHMCSGLVHAKMYTSTYIDSTTSTSFGMPDTRVGKWNAYESTCNTVSCESWYAWCYPYLWSSCSCTPCTSWTSWSAAHVLYNIVLIALADREESLFDCRHSEVRLCCS